MKSYYTTGSQKKADCFEAMGCYFHFCPCQEATASLTVDDIKRASKKRQIDELRKDYIREKGYSVEEM